MFTFSFGSAFAAADYNKSLANEYFNVAMNAVKDAETIEINGYTVDYSTLDAHRADLLAAALDWAKNFDTTGAAQEYVDSATDLQTLIEADNDLLLTIVAAQYDADKAEAVAILNGVSVSDFSTAEMDPECKVDGHTCKTYQDHVKAILADAVDEINEKTFTSDSVVKDYVDAKKVIDKYFGEYANNNQLDGEATLIAEKGYVGAQQTKIGLGVYEINEDYIDNGTVLGHYTTDYVKGQDAVTAADIAALKAQVAAAYAGYLRTKDADKTFAADMQKILNFLIEEKKIVATPDNGGFPKYFEKDAYATKAAAAVKDVASLEAEAAKLAAETDANGALVRDAKDVADLVKAGTIAVYKNAIDPKLLGEGEDGNYTTYIGKIKALYASLDDAKLAYYKKWVETKINKSVADAEDDYYAPEYAKLKALAEEYIAKINAAADNDEVTKLYTKFGNAVRDILDASRVDKKVPGALLKAAHDYADLVNRQITKEANKYYVADNYAKLDSEIKKLVGASEARTTKDINALSDQILALVKALPTNSAVDAAKEAADDAVKALPKGTVTTADKALIDAAVTAVKAYEDLTAVEDYRATELKAAATKYAFAFNNEMAAKVKAVSQTDKAAIKALVAEIEAVEDAYDYEEVENALKGEKGTLKGYLEKIQKTEFDAVMAAVAAIPVKENITEAAKDKVVAARALYDAYVAEYTEYDSEFKWDDCPTKDGFVADDFAQAYTELVAAETLLGLNQESPAKAVESLKITARSTAKKGSITVKWTVKGEADIDGYQIWKSKKANSGYKKAFTTTKKTYKNSKGLKKGTRYYYKVRAYKVVDGKNVYSDWSNKANRKAK